jgi:uncharacterized protein YjdB
LVPAATLQLTATAKDAAGQLLQRSFVWTTSDSAKATVSPEGIVVALAPGTAIITATVDGRSEASTGKSGTSVITVVPVAAVATVDAATVSNT